jgi:LPXTG-motif cell wall-anchored protein
MSTPTDATDATTYPTADATSMDVPTVEGNLTIFLADNNVTERQLYDILVARLQETDDSFETPRQLEAWEIVLIVLGVVLILLIGFVLFKRQRDSEAKQIAAISAAAGDLVPRSPARYSIARGLPRPRPFNLGLARFGDDVLFDRS